MTTTQPAPIQNGRMAIADLVMIDILERKKEGIKKYGTPLQAFNGRNSLQDAYEEALDLAIYLRQVIEEQKEIEDENDLTKLGDQQHVTHMMVGGGIVSSGDE